MRSSRVTLRTFGLYLPYGRGGLEVPYDSTYFDDGSSIVDVPGFGTFDGFLEMTNEVDDTLEARTGRRPLAEIDGLGYGPDGVLPGVSCVTVRPAPGVDERIAELERRRASALEHEGWAEAFADQAAAAER